MAEAAAEAPPGSVTFAAAATCESPRRSGFRPSVLGGGGGGGGRSPADEPGVIVDWAVLRAWLERRLMQERSQINDFMRDRHTDMVSQFAYAGKLDPDSPLLSAVDVASTVAAVPPAMLPCAVKPTILEPPAATSASAIVDADAMDVLQEEDNVDLAYAAEEINDVENPTSPGSGSNVTPVVLATPAKLHVLESHAEAAEASVPQSPPRISHVFVSEPQHRVSLTKLQERGMGPSRSLPSNTPAPVPVQASLNRGVSFGFRLRQGTRLDRALQKIMIDMQMSSRQEKRPSSCRLPAWQDVKDFALGHQIELASGLVIMLNTGTMALQRQYEGFDTAAFVLEIPGAQPATTVWPSMAFAFNVCEFAFGLIFLAEVLLKIVVMKLDFFRNTWWNWFDAIIVLAWCIDRFPSTAMPTNPMILRLARLARLVRLLRIVRWVKFFDPLHLMVKAIQSSWSMLVWSLILLGMLMMVIAMFVGTSLQSAIENEDRPLQQRTEIFLRWGNFSRAFVTMLEITLGNWGPPCWMLMNNVHEAWGVFFIVYKCSFGFAVVQVITSVFIQQTFKVASRDEEVMIKEKRAATAAYIRNLERLFDALDESGDGKITWDEFSVVVDDEKLKAWLAALELDSSDLESLFLMLDDGDGQISRDEFINSVKRIKGDAKTMDMIQLRQEVRKLGKALRRLPEFDKESYYHKSHSNWSKWSSAATDEFGQSMPLRTLSLKSRSGVQVSRQRSCDVAGGHQDVGTFGVVPRVSIAAETTAASRAVMEL